VTGSCGATAVNAGAGFSIVNVTEFELPPPGEGLETVICDTAALARFVEDRFACNCVALTNVVGSALPFHRTTEDAMKPLPVRVTVVAEAPTVTEAGFSVVTNGAGLFTVKATAEEVPPPGAGEVTVICTVPALARSADVSVAFSCVALTKDVWTAFPLPCTTEDATKPLPVTVTPAEVVPTITEAGEIEPMAGAGLLTDCVIVCGAVATLLPPPPHEIIASNRIMDASAKEIYREPLRSSRTESPLHRRKRQRTQTLRLARATVKQ